MKNTKRLVAQVILITTCLFLGGCADMNLRYQDVAGFRAVEVQKDGINYLHISGLTMNSALYIDSIEQEIHGSDLIVLMHMSLSPKDKSSSGSFDTFIEIKPEVSRILFGQDAQVVWKRSPS